MIGRRPLFAAAGAALVAQAAQAALAAPAPERIPLWPGTPPGGGGPQGPERVSAKGSLRDIPAPYLTLYRPQAPNGAAVLVAGGGGYRHIELGMEADPAARWLNARGITAFTLAYRLPGEGWAAGPQAPFQDAQRAIRLIRARAKRYGLDAQRLGVLGFSAGGHLLGLAADWSDFRSYAPVDGADFLSARPDNAALAYPIITLEPPYQHTSTAKILVGQDASPQARAEWSVQTHLRPGAPSFFLVQAKDDPISNPANTIIMARACKQAGVPVDFHQLPSGGHGFGMGRPGTPTMEWPGWYENWLRAQGMLVS